MKLSKSKLLNIIQEEYSKLKKEGGKGSGRKPDDHTGGPSYSNVPKGAKTSKQARKMQKIEKEMDKAVSDANAKLDAAEREAKKKKKVKEGGPGSGPHGNGNGNGDDEENPFDREPSDDELADIEKQYEGKLNERRPPKDEYFVKQVTTASKAINDMLRIFPKTSFGKDKNYLKMLKMIDKELVNNTKKILGYNESVKEGRTRLSPSRDLDIHTKGSMAVLYGKKHKLAIDKESMKKLVDLIRRNMGLYELRKLKEGKSFKLPNGMKIEFINQQQIVLSKGGKRVYLDVSELRMFLKGVKKDMGVRA